MNLNISDIAPAIYAELKDVYYIKLTIEKLGLYISGITVRRSPKYGSWWVQMPYYKDYKSGQTKRYIEFKQDSEIRLQIEQLCIKVIEEKDLDSKNQSTDILPTEEDMKEEADFSNV